MSAANTTFYLITYTNAQGQQKVIVNVSPPITEPGITKNGLVIKSDADADQVWLRFRDFPNVKFAGVRLNEVTQAVACNLDTVENEATLAGLLTTEHGWEQDGPNNTMDFQAFWADATTSSRNVPVTSMRVLWEMQTVGLMAMVGLPAYEYRHPDGINNLLRVVIEFEADSNSVYGFPEAVEAGRP
jgi:hypothetical protein